MNRLLFALLALGALALGLVWLRGSTRGEHATSSASAAEDEAASLEGSALASPIAETPPVEESEIAKSMDVATAEPGSAPSASSARQEVAGAYQEELARATWVEGLVRFPPSTPADEDVFVVAEGEDFEHGAFHRVAVERDGAFRVAFSESTWSGRLRLDARYLYLEGGTRAWRKNTATPLVLEPQLGGRIVGRVIPPEGVAPEAVGGSVKLLEEQRGPRGGPIIDAGSVALAGDFTYEFGGLAEAWVYRLLYEGESLVCSSLEVKVEAGRTRRADLELRHGVELSGRTLDEDREPLSGVQVHASVQTDDPLNPAGELTAESGADGSFRTRPLLPGPARLYAIRKGYLSAEQDFGVLAAGERRANIELVLADGLAIAGRVVWPDGSPAEATVTAQSETQPDWEVPTLEEGERCAPDGSFRISGLPADTYRLQALATKTEEIVEPSEGTGREHKRKERSVFQAELQHVAGGTEDVVLTLITGSDISGRVVDDLDSPVVEFRVTAERMVAYEYQSSVEPQDELSKSFRDTAGSFAFDGLLPGAWQFTAESDGYGRGQPAHISVPSGETPLLVLPREATVRGVVLEASGTPVEGALVLAEESVGNAYANNESLETDANGAFVFTGLSPGSLKLVAKQPGRAMSAPLVVQLTAGQEVTDVVLQLRAGGTITGEVLGYSGSEVEVSVAAHSWSTDYSASLRLDSAGRFEARGVPPGEVALWLDTTGGLTLTQNVTVAEGETVHVRFAPGELRPVRLHGQVLSGGKPVSSASVLVALRIRSGSRAHTDQTNDEGFYELTLPRAGNYDVHVKWNRMSWIAPVAIPEVAGFPFDVSIPVGRISGRVRLEDGRGAPAVQVMARCGGWTERRGLGHARADEDGRYELSVPAGTYTVTAGGDSGEAHRAGRSLAETRVESVVVAEDAHVRGIDLVLAEGGTLEGIARLAGGSLAGQIVIWARNDGGETRTLGWSQDGRFRILGVAPGKHLIGASGQSVAARTWVEVEVEAGSVAHVELELVAAAGLVVRVVDASGARTEAEVELLGEDGRRHATETFEGVTSSSDLLPAGSYVVRARRGEQFAERRLEISGTQREVELVLR